MTAAETRVTFTVTPAAGAPSTHDRISALYTTGTPTGYTDDIVRVVPPVEGRSSAGASGRSTRPGSPRTRRRAAGGPRTGPQPIPLGGTVTVPVVVHNWSDTTQDGDVSLTLPADVTADAASKPYGPLTPGAEETVEFELTSAHPTLPDPQTADVGITTSFGAAVGATETLPALDPAHDRHPCGRGADGRRHAGRGRVHRPGARRRPALGGGDCAPAGTDCGTTGTVGDPATSTFAKVQRAGDDLYFFVHVRDDFQSYAVTPSECVAHWLADSVEFLIDPRGNSSERNTDTASTFKLGVFPFTNDPSNFNGNGVNGPCWSRDADNHQGYATGPLQSKVANAPNAPGVQVASSATWVGTNNVSTPHAYAGGGYDLEVKIPMAILPAAVDPDRMGLNITPYDNDDNSANGVLRHIDAGKTRVAGRLRQRAVRPVPLGRGDAAGLHAARGPADRGPGRERVQPEPQRGALAADDRAVGARRRADRRARPGAGRRPDHDLAATLAAGSAELDITASGPGTPGSISGPASRARSRCGRRAARRPTTRRRTTA